MFIFLIYSCPSIFFRSMTEYDKEKFPSDMRQVVWSDFLYTYALGARTYLVKAGDASTPAERRKLLILKFAHYTVIGVFYLLVLWLVYLCWPFVRQHLY